MITELIKIANTLDQKGYYDLANELDSICKEAAEPSKPKMSFDEALKILGLSREEIFEIVEEEKTRWEIPFDDDHPFSPPDERVKPLFRGKKDERDPDDLSTEDLSGDYLETTTSS